MHDLVPFTTLPNGNKVSNFFIVNPQTTGGAFVMTNGINTTFNALQVELRRRLSNGLLVQGSYQFARALSNSYTNSDSVFSNPRTLRRPDLDKAGSPWDIRHAFKVDWIYELPFGPGKPFLSSNNPILSRVVGGWQMGGVVRIQSGPSMLFTGGRAHFQSERCRRRSSQHHKQAATKPDQDSQDHRVRSYVSRCRAVAARFDHRQHKGGV